VLNTAFKASNDRGFYPDQRHALAVICWAICEQRRK